MNESLKKKKAVDNTMEGGTSDRSSRKSIIPLTFSAKDNGDATPKKNIPVIMYPPETDVETKKSQRAESP
jgi:hypothetical protein